MIRACSLGLVGPGLLTGTALTQTVGDWDDHRSSAFALAEPRKENSRRFANGAVRLAMTDTIEPVVGLTFQVRATRSLPETADFADARLQVTLNQATGLVTAQLED